MRDTRSDLAAAALRDYHATAHELAERARAIIASFLRHGHEAVRKPDGSLVTNADIEIEKQLSAMLQARFPEHGVMGEELPAVNPGSEYQWILDPIDGTEDFARGLPYFGSIIALHFRGLPIVGVIDHPVLDVRCSACFGRGAIRNRSEVIASLEAQESGIIAVATRANFTRHDDDGAVFDALLRANQNVRTFRTCYAHTSTVLGMTDAMVEWDVRPWDLAATRLLTEESGGRYVTLRDADRPGTGRVCSAVFGKHAAVERLLEVMRHAGWRDSN